MSKKINRAQAAAGLAKFCDVKISTPNPTLYDWIGVAAKSGSSSEASSEQIAFAIKGAISKLKNTPTAQRDSDWQEAAQVIQLAKSQLLNASARRKYDAQLRSENRLNSAQTDRHQTSTSRQPAQPVNAVSSADAADYSSRQFLPALLPAVDPRDVDRCRELIKSRLRDSLAQTRPLTPTEQFVAEIEDQAPVEAILVQERNATNSNAANALGSIVSGQSVTAKRRQKRKNHRVRMLVMIGGLLVSVLFVGGVGYFLLNNDTSWFAAVQQQPDIDTDNQGTQGTSPRSLGSNQAKPTTSSLTELSRDELQESNTSQKERLPVDSNDSDENSPVSDDAENAIVDVVNEASPNENDSKTDVFGKTDSGSSPARELTEADIAEAWRLMELAREAALLKDFESFDQHIEKASMIARSEALKTKFERLDQFGQLYKIFLDSIDESINRLPAGGVIQSGNTQMSFVSAESNQLTFRIGGKNQSFDKSSLPLGIVLALADMSLDENAEVDAGARWVYLLVRGKKDFTARRQAKKIASDLAGSDSILPTLDKVLTDSYP